MIAHHRSFLGILAKESGVKMTPAEFAGAFDFSLPTAERLAKEPKPGDYALRYSTFRKIAGTLDVPVGAVVDIYSESVGD